MHRWLVIGMGIVGFGCGEGGAADSDATDDVAATAASDVEDLARAVEDTAAAFEETTETCYATWGECQLCVTVTTSGLSGEFSIVNEPATCSESRTAPNGASATYTLEGLSFAGAYDGTVEGDYTIDMTGTRSATLTTSTARGGERTYDASFTLEHFTATTDDYALATFEATFTYSGFADGDWTVQVSGTAESVTGTLTGPNGAGCTVTGTPESVDVTCDEPSA